MKLHRFLLPCLAIGAAATLLWPADSEAYNLLGGDLSVQSQRDVRLFDNFTDATANGNVATHPMFPGYTGAEMAIWKACVEWGSRLHGDGTGDSTQTTTLGSGGANFDVSWQGNATGIGTTDENIVSELQADGGGVYAFCESPISNGWRIRFYRDPWTWDDGPGSLPGGRVDIQGIATHEYGHSLGLDHTGVANATMQASTSPAGSINQRSIATDDINGVQAIYGVADVNKPIITTVNKVGGQIEITGSDFDASNNEVWFTQAGTGGPGTPVKAFGVASSGGGTFLSATIPATAGSGDVLVRVPGNGHEVLSNSYPFDITSGPTCLPLNYCISSPNSVGPGATMSWSGSTSVAANDFQLDLSGLPPGTIGIFYTGTSTTLAPFGNGWNCNAGTVLRFGAMNADLLGLVSYALNFNTYPGNQMSDDGTIWGFQFWYRNPAGGGAGFNTSDGVRTPWCP